MTNTNTTPRVTNAVALRTLIDAAVANGCPDAEAIEKAEKMYEQYTAKRKPTGPTKKQRENAALVNEIVGQMRGREPMTLVDIAEAFGLSSWQKASALMKAAIANGIVSVDTSGKKNLYSALQSVSRETPLGSKGVSNGAYPAA